MLRLELSGKFANLIKAQKKNAKVFSNLEKYIYNHFDDKTLEQPHLNLKYYSSNFECFSAWTSGEMKAFTDFIDKLRKAKWQDIFNSGGALGQKTGFARTDIDTSKYPKGNALLKDVSEEIKMFELRVDQKIRVHGFRCHDAFFLVYLDREHRIGKK